jgi:TM2 domain
MRVKILLLFYLLFFTTIASKAESFSNLENDSAFDCIQVDVCSDANQDLVVLKVDRLDRLANSKLSEKYKSAFQENRRLTAAMLTFALGMLGVHRLYLGTKPWIPAVYLLTLGGGFLILPLIDLGVILFSKDISQYEHNDKFLMWVK